MVVNDLGDIGTYFDRSEFACSCGCKLDNIDPRLVHLLDKIREALGHPLVVTSGCRCADYNKAVGGSGNSAHLRGLAVDLKVANGRDRFRVVTIATRWGVSRIGIHKDFIHLDTDDSLLKEVIWVYG